MPATRQSLMGETKGSRSLFKLVYPWKHHADNRFYSSVVAGTHNDGHSPRHPQSRRDLVHNVMVADEDGRRTEEQYAAEKNLRLRDMQNHFAATGVLMCGDGARLSAQLTGANNVITTAGHAVYDRKTCKQPHKPESCLFKVKVGNLRQVSRVKKLAAIGYKCPAAPHAGWSKAEADARGP